MIKILIKPSEKFRKIKGFNGQVFTVDVKKANEAMEHAMVEQSKKRLSKKTRSIA